MKNIEMMKGAKKLVDVCAGGVKANDKVLIVTDTNNINIAEIITSVAFERGAEVALCIMTVRKNNGENPPEMICQAMMRADIIFAPTTFSMTWAEATRKAASQGARVVSMPDYNEDILVSGGLEADFPAQEKIVEKMSELFSKAHQARLTTPAGTDLSMELGDRTGNSEKGFCSKAGEVCGPPNIESNIAPIEETANGKIVCDASIIHPDIRKLDEPVCFTVKDGFVVDIEGGSKAKRMKEVLAELKDPTVYNIAELGIGFNPKAKIIGLMTEDEGCLGTAHIGLGDNHTRQGKVTSPLHIDLVLKDPTLFLDDKLIIKNSELLF
jgi:2,5-dihydroxypyridine 5,6-dioxygenase